jgi:hypothetical protein
MFSRLYKPFEKHNYYTKSNIKNDSVGSGCDKDKPLSPPLQESQNKRPIERILNESSTKKYKYQKS